MSVISYIIIFTFIGSIASLMGGILLIFRKEFAMRVSHYLAAFAAGTLLAGAFFDLLPEAIEHTLETGGEVHNVLLWTVAGILIFFFLERSIHWFHHDHSTVHDNVEPTVPLVILGDTVHNFIDGIVIGSTFLISIPLGIVTTIAIAAHEIPQEIGDFGILLHNGLSRIKIIFVNVLSAAAALFGALIAYAIGDSIEGLLPAFLAITAGFFIYIALADIIPGIHNSHKRGRAYLETAMVFIGIAVVYFITSYFLPVH